MLNNLAYVTPSRTATLLESLTLVIVINICCHIIRLNILTKFVTKTFRPPDGAYILLSFSCQELRIGVKLSV